MGYVSGIRQQRRFPAGLAGANPLALGSLGFDWGDFATQVGESAAKSAASAGISKLSQTIAGTGGTKTVTAAPAVTQASMPAASTSLGTIPVWAWALGGLGLVLILVLAIGRR